MDPTASNPPAANPPPDPNVPDPNLPPAPSPDINTMPGMVPPPAGDPMPSDPLGAATLSNGGDVQSPAVPVEGSLPIDQPTNDIASPPSPQPEAPNPFSQAPAGSSFGDQMAPAPAPEPAPESMPSAFPAESPAMSSPSGLGSVEPALQPPSDTQNMGGFAPPPQAAEAQFGTPDLAAGPAPQPLSPVPEASGVPESAPTDLSHLVYNSGAEPVPAQPAESLVVPQPAAEATTVSNNTGSKGFPKWLIIVGVLLVLIVAGLSAYFILGVGRSAPPSASLPAEQQPLANPPQQVIPTQPAPPAATASAGFGNISGATSSAKESTSSSKPSSALELLRQRQGK